MERAICVVQHAPISRAWDLFSQKQVLCGRTAARGAALADIIFSSIVLIPARCISPELWSVSSCAEPPFPCRWRHPGGPEGAAGTAGGDRGRDERALRSHPGMLQAHRLTARMPVLLMALYKRLLPGIK